MDMFDRAIVVAQIKAPLDACAKALGEPPCKLEYEISDAKAPKPRKQRADAGKARSAEALAKARAERAASLIREAAE